MKRALSQRQIPTLLGLAILIAALVGGIALFGQGGGVFAPRATAQTTPKNIKITNIKDTSFTVSFITDESTAGFVKYGTSADKLTFQASDDRDQLNGSVGQYNTHYITVRDLDPATQYYFTLGTASVPKTDNNGAPFQITTAPRGGNLGAAQTAYGTVNGPDGRPGDGAIVYMTMPGASELSALVKSSGSYAVPLSTARTEDLSGYINLDPTTTVTLFVQGTSVNSTATAQTTLAETEPIQTITLLTGASGSSTAVETIVQPPSSEPPAQSLDAEIDGVTSGTTDDNPVSEGTSLTGLTAVADNTASPSSQESRLTDLTNVSPSATQTQNVQSAQTVDMTLPGAPTVETDKPTITGKAAPNAVITIQVNSDTQIVTQVQTDEHGNFTLPLSSGDASLEPGEHTVTITYTDPTTGQERTETKTFYVAESESLGTGGGGSTLLAQAQTSPSPVPYGSDNPFTIPSPSPSPSASASASPTASASASPRVAMPPTTSEVPKSGAVSTTIFLIIGGFFMIGLGIWTYKHNSHQAYLDSDLDSIDE